ncbi:6-phosphofructo-2-kinase-domain-containing protein [Blastocladiella britannica]|nr:6-phosphofructo-2-kinase-domain-containing protein [Blastocladiella britannica]
MSAPYPYPHYQGQQHQQQSQMHHPSPLPRTGSGLHLAALTSPASMHLHAAGSSGARTPSPSRLPMHLTMPSLGLAYAQSPLAMSSSTSHHNGSGSGNGNGDGNCPTPPLQMSGVLPSPGVGDVESWLPDAVQGRNARAAAEASSSATASEAGAASEPTSPPAGPWQAAAAAQPPLSVTYPSYTIADSLAAALHLHLPDPAAMVGSSGSGPGAQHHARQQTPTADHHPPTPTPSPGPHLIVFMVGLPGRGKSYISMKLTRYLTWLGYSPRVFNVGNRRRVAAATTPDTPIAGKGTSSAFFDPTNASAAHLRDQLALETLDELVDWVYEPVVAAGSSTGDSTPMSYGSPAFQQPGPTVSSSTGSGGRMGTKVAIHDATNSTQARRELLVRHLKSRKALRNAKILFLESVCTDPAVIAANVRLKLQGPDYQGVDAAAAIADFERRMRNYERAYQPLGAYEDQRRWAYIKIIDVGRQVVTSHIRGYLCSQLVFYLMNTHIQHRTIWLTRHGESVFNVQGRLGGDAGLTPRGERYAAALERFFSAMYAGDVPCAPRFERVAHVADSTSRDLPTTADPPAIDVTDENPKAKSPVISVPSFTETWLRSTPAGSLAGTPAVEEIDISVLVAAGSPSTAPSPTIGLVSLHQQQQRARLPRMGTGPSSPSSSSTAALAAQWLAAAAATTTSATASHEPTSPQRQRRRTLSGGSPLSAPPATDSGIGGGGKVVTEVLLQLIAPDPRELGRTASRMDSNSSSSNGDDEDEEGDDRSVRTSGNGDQGCDDTCRTTATGSNNHSGHGSHDDDNGEDDDDDDHLTDSDGELDTALATPRMSAVRRGCRRHRVRHVPVWTSTLRRSLDTAAPLSVHLRFPLRSLRVLNEIHSGMFEAMTPLEIETAWPGEVARRVGDKLAYRYPGLGGESYLDVIARLKPLIIECERMTRDCIVVSHNVVARIMLAYFVGVPWDQMPRLEVPLHTVFAMQPKPYGTEVVRFVWDEERDEIVRAE